MIKKLLCSLMLLSISIFISAADNFTVSGKITNKNNNEPLSMVGIRLMKSDSSYVTGMATNEQGIFILKLEKGGNYILKITSVGYKPVFRNISLSPQNKSAALGTIPLEEDAIALKEATITAKVARVEVKEDTFVYNAAAYKVPEGAYLESLIDQLPGAVVEDDGSITINGKTVSQIRVDGKDFFKGDNSIPMKNLPADFVKKIKAYDKKSDYTEQTGIDDGEEETVLDLELKDKLKRAWTGNLDAAAGTKHRYSTQLFANGLTDNSRITPFFNLNNTNTRGFGRRGGGNGLTATKAFGVDGNWNNGKKERTQGFFEIGGRFDYNYRGTDNTTESNSETFFAGQQSSFSNSASKSLSSNKSARGNAYIKWNPDSLTTLTFRPNFSYSESHNSSISRTATFNSDPYELGASPLDSIFRSLQDPDDIAPELKLIAVNRNSNQSFSDNRDKSFNADFNVTRRLNKLGRNISFGFNSSYSDSESKSFSLSDIHYYQTQNHRVNHQYSTSPSKNWSYSARLSYSEPLIKGLYLQTSYNYEHRYRDQDRNLYQLDSLDGYGHNGITPLHPLGWLPEGDSLMLARNIENSRYATYVDNIHTINLGLRFVNDKFNVNAGVRIRPERTELDYKKNTLDTTVVRNLFKLAPNARFRYSFTKMSKFELRYDGNSSEPNMTNLLDITDNSDPLNISKGNPNLKPSWTNSFSAEYNNYFRASQSAIAANASYSNTENSISNAVIYDPETGVRTTRPENINGNWNARVSFMFSTSFSDESPFRIQTNTNYRYNNSVAFVSLNQQDSQKSTSRTNNITQRLRFSYKTGLFEFSLNGSLNYQNSRNHLQPQGNRETYNYNYGGNIQFNANNGFPVSTNMGMNSRRGYSDKSMNTNELLWNAQLSQAFLEGKRAVISLQFYDILHRQSNISRSISAYSRTDSRSNSINSYILLHFIYKLNIFNGSNGKMKAERSERQEMSPDGPGMMPPGAGGMRGAGGGMGGPGGRF